MYRKRIKRDWEQIIKQLIKLRQTIKLKGVNHD